MPLEPLLISLAQRLVRQDFFIRKGAMTLRVSVASDNLHYHKPSCGSAASAARTLKLRHRGQTLCQPRSLALSAARRRGSSRMMETWGGQDQPPWSTHTTCILGPASCLAGVDFLATQALEREVREQPVSVDAVPRSVAKAAATLARSLVGHHWRGLRAGFSSR